MFLGLLASSVQGQSFPLLKWQKFYGGSGDEVPAAILRTMDGNLIIGGTVSGEGTSGCTDMWIIKVDPEGKLIWERKFGGSGCDELRDIASTPDQGVLFVGITSSFIQHPEKGQEEFQGDYFVGKLTKNGEIEFLKTYGGLDIDQAYSITHSGNWPEYLVAGASSSQNFDVQTDLGMANLWCLKVDYEGNKRTSWAFGGNKHDWAYSVFGCRDGDYVFAGYTNSEDLDGSDNRANGDGWVGRIDRYGHLEWQRIYSGKYEDFFTKIIEDSQGRIVLVGNFESEEKGKQFWFLKLTPDGKKIYERIFGDRMDEYATSVAETSDGGYIVTGYSKYINLYNKYIKGGEDFWVFRLDPRGNIVWVNTFGGRDDERGIDIVEFEPGVYYAIGEKKNDFAGDKGKDFWLLKIVDARCDDGEIQVSTSLKDYTAYKNRNFKCRVRAMNASKYLWDFGDGTTSDKKEPVHAYTMPGVYEVKVTVFFNENCSKTVELPQFVMVW